LTTNDDNQYLKLSIFVDKLTMDHFMLIEAF